MKTEIKFNDYNRSEIFEETIKAIHVKVNFTEYYHKTCKYSRSAKWWIPKSVIDKNGDLAPWFLEKNEVLKYALTEGRVSPALFKKHLISKGVYVKDEDGRYRRRK